MKGKNANEKEPLQAKFYYRGKKKMENEKLLQEMVIHL